MDPVVVVLVMASGAALAAVLGVLPLAGRRRAPTAWLGWANAIAAGAMLAAAYVLAQAGLGVGAGRMGLGALGGIAWVYFSHRLAGTHDLRLNRLDDEDVAYGYQVLLVGSLHSGAEGLAIGAAMAHDVALGTFVAAAIGLHNIPEATLLGAVFRARGESLGRSALLALVSGVGLVLAAVSTFAILAATPGALAAGLGFAAGALIYLVTVDLLPESYEQAGSTTIALVTILSMGLVIALQRWMG